MPYVAAENDEVMEAVVLLHGVSRVWFAEFLAWRMLQCACTCQAWFSFETHLALLYLLSDVDLLFTLITQSWARSRNVFDSTVQCK